jgi:tRNA 2-thiouridine synthesizing protein A
MHYDIDLDCEGLLCPLPVLRARKRLLSMPPGRILRIRATDPMAAVDLPHFCAETGHEFLGLDRNGSITCCYIRATQKGGTDPAPPP